MTRVQLVGYIALAVFIVLDIIAVAGLTAAVLR